MVLNYLIIVEETVAADVPLHVNLILGKLHLNDWACGL